MEKIKVEGKTPPLPYYLLYCPPPPPFLPTPNPPSKYVMIMPAIIAIATTIINGYVVFIIRIAEFIAVLNGDVELNCVTSYICELM